MNYLLECRTTFPVCGAFRPAAPFWRLAGVSLATARRLSKISGLRRLSGALPERPWQPQGATTKFPACGAFTAPCQNVLGNRKAPQYEPHQKNAPAPQTELGTFLITNIFSSHRANRRCRSARHPTPPQSSWSPPRSGPGSPWLRSGRRWRHPCTAGRPQKPSLPDHKR